MKNNKQPRRIAKSSVSPAIGGISVIVLPDVPLTAEALPKREQIALGRRLLGLPTKYEDIQ